MLQTNIKEKIFNLKILMKILKISEEKQGDFYKRQKIALKFFIILHSRKQRTNIYTSFTAKQIFHV